MFNKSDSLTRFSAEGTVMH